MSSLILRPAPKEYDPKDQASIRDELRREIDKTLKRGQDIDLGRAARITLTASDGEQVVLSGGAADVRESIGVAYYDTRTAAAAANVLAVLVTLTTGSYATAGDGGGATYKRAASEPDHAGKFQSADGAWWEYAPGDVVNAHAFGVIADGAYNNETGEMTGTDATAALQAAIDFGIYYAKKPAWFAGMIRTTAPNHLGYGHTYLAGHLLGVGKTIAPEHVGSTILCDFDHGMAINIQAARGSTIKGVTFVGKNYVWMATNQLASIAGLPLNGKDDRVMADWIDSALPATANARYTPYAAIVIDGYSGVAPGTPYPTVTYPSWTGIGATQYGKNPSSNVIIEECSFFGWVGFVAVQPSNISANGDFVRVRSCHGERCAWVYSIGNNQSRSVETSNNTWNSCHSVYVTGLHGTQNGRIGGESSNEHFGQCIQIVSIANDSIAGPMLFTAAYGEECWRLGDYGGAAASGSGIVWVNPLFVFDLQGAHARGVPATLLGGLAASKSARTIIGGNLKVYDLCPLGGAVENWTIDGPSLSFLSDTALTETYEKIIRNYLAGGFMFQLESPVGGGWPAHFNAQCMDSYNITTGAQTGARVYDSDFASDRSRGLCAWSRWAHNTGNPGLTVTHTPPQDRYIDIGSEVTSADFGTDGVLTVTFNARAAVAFGHYGPEPGDILQLGNTCFKVFSRDDQEVLAQIANNYEVDGSGDYSVIGASGGIVGGEAVDFEAGRMGCFNARRFMPQYYTRCDMSTSVDPTILTAVGRDDGFGGYVDPEVLADDWIFVDDQIDRWIDPGSAKVVTVDDTALEITLSGSVAKTRTDHAIKFITRKPPANL